MENLLGGIAKCPEGKRGRYYYRCVKPAIKKPATKKSIKKCPEGKRGRYYYRCADPAKKNQVKKKTTKKPAQKKEKKEVKINTLNKLQKEYPKLLITDHILSDIGVKKQIDLSKVKDYMEKSEKMLSEDKSQLEKDKTRSERMFEEIKKSMDLSKVIGESKKTLSGDILQLQKDKIRSERMFEEIKKSIDKKNATKKMTTHTRDDIFTDKAIKKLISDEKKLEKELKKVKKNTGEIGYIEKKLEKELKRVEKNTSETEYVDWLREQLQLIEEQKDLGKEKKEKIPGYDEEIILLREIKRLSESGDLVGSIDLAKKINPLRYRSCVRILDQLDSDNPIVKQLKKEVNKYCKVPKEQEMKQFYNRKREAERMAEEAGEMINLIPPNYNVQDMINFYRNDN